MEAPTVKSSFGVVLDELNKGGMTVEVTRQDVYGRLHPAKPQELGTLGTKTRIAESAKLIQSLNKEEKLIWALATKDEANAHYREGRFVEAMEMYVQALTAANFVGATTNKEENDGDSSSANSDSTNDSNVDSLVVPVLCNLAACCLQLSQWAKALQFVDQALQLRPQTAKALYRQGVAFYHVGEFSASLHSLEHALQLAADSNAETTEQSVTTLTDSECNKAKQWQQKSRAALKKENEALHQRKVALQKAFQSTTSTTSTNVNSTPTPPTLSTQPKKGPTDPVSFFIRLGCALWALFVAILEMIVRVIKQKFRRPAKSRTPSSE